MRGPPPSETQGKRKADPDMSGGRSVAKGGFQCGVSAEKVRERENKGNHRGVPMTMEAKGMHF